MTAAFPELGKDAGPARLGIGGPVGSGKTALIECLVPALQNRG
ncbi:MAG: urease accessory protein UreG, partial [Alphaproteobacteria bacterium]